jgi:hypothetical protein
MKTTVRHSVRERIGTRLLILISLSGFGPIPGMQVCPVRAADAVIVTMTLDEASIGVGESTTLRVWGKVAPAVESASDRIFSWYIDGVNPAPGTAAPRWDELLMPASDSPTGSTSSSSRGTTQGANRVGIRNTFLTKPGAGVLAPVELFEVEVTGVAAGNVVLSVRAGTGTPTITHDFQVARQGGGQAFTGGVYTSASVILTVTGEAADDDDLDGLTNAEEATLGSNPLLSDTDHDGLGDLEEYAWGSSLLSPSSASRPVAARAFLNVGGVTSEYQELIVHRDPAAQQVSTRVEFSSGLTDWQLTAVLVSTQNNPDGTVTETWRCPQPVENVDRCFLRATVVRP